MLLEIDEKAHEFHIWSSIPEDGNLMRESTHTMGKAWVLVSQVLPIRLVFSDFSRNLFPRLFPFDEFCCLSPCYWKLMRKPMNFTYDKVYHRIGTYRKKALKLWNKYGNQFPRLFPFDGFYCIFPYYGKLMRKHMHFPYDEVYHRMGIDG